MNGDDFYRRRARRRLIGVAAAVVVAGGVFWYLSRSESLGRIASFENAAERFAAQELSQSFSAPPPLVVKGVPARPGSAGASGSSASRYTLTRAGDIADTNAARRANSGLPPLKENAALDAVASLRVRDMFARQYFAHISPPNLSGATSSAETVAKAVGYDYFALGENLALGNFASDQDLVDAWMKSPGHRANILNTHYTEIGVAVLKGNFEGDSVWIAVQVFGRPASDCPAPDANLKVRISAEEDQISQMQSVLAAARAQLDAMELKYGDAYNQKVDEYNTLVAQYNNLVAQTKTDVAQYNAEVGAYNQCLAA